MIKARRRRISSRYRDRPVHEQVILYIRARCDLDRIAIRRLGHSVSDAPARLAIHEAVVVTIVAAHSHEPVSSHIVHLEGISDRGPHPRIDAPSSERHRLGNATGRCIGHVHHQRHHGAGSRCEIGDHGGRDPRPPRLETGRDQRERVRGIAEVVHIVCVGDPRAGVEVLGEHRSDGHRRAPVDIGDVGHDLVQRRVGLRGRSKHYRCHRAAQRVGGNEDADRHRCRLAAV